METMLYVLIIIAAFVPATFYMFYVIAFDYRKLDPFMALVLAGLVGMMGTYVSIQMGLLQSLADTPVLTRHGWGESALIGFLRLMIPAELVCLRHRAFHAQVYRLLKMDAREYFKKRHC